MKRLLIGVIAFALTLGVACKKEEFAKEPKKADNVKPVVKAEADGDVVIGTNPFGLPPAPAPHKCVGETDAENYKLHHPGANCRCYRDFGPDRGCRSKSWPE
jgi:hypothetical protein